MFLICYKAWCNKYFGAYNRLKDYLKQVVKSVNCTKTYNK